MNSTAPSPINDFFSSTLFTALSTSYNAGDSSLKSHLGSYHPQTAFEFYYRLLCNQFTAFQIMTIGSFLVQVILYFTFSIPSAVFQHIPAMQKYKLQAGKYIAWEDQWFCIKTVAWAKISIYLPLSMCIYYVLSALSLVLPYDYDSMPAWYNLLPKLYIALLMEDCWHYWAHRLLHHKAIYGRIHKLHHKYNVPFALAAEFAHPIETLVLGVGFFIPMCFFLNHLYLFWAWLLVRMLQTTEVHCGYYFPYLNPLHLLPFYGGAQMHDYHHEKFTANYASTFTFWDWLCSTDTGFEAKKAGHDLKLKKSSKAQ
jgi:methylsterol monooxygenase